MVAATDRKVPASALTSSTSPPHRSFRELLRRSLVDSCPTPTDPPISHSSYIPLGCSLPPPPPSKRMLNITRGSKPPHREWTLRSFLYFTLSPPRGLINIFNFTHVPFQIYMTPPPSFPPIPSPALFRSFSQTLLFPDHGRCCCRPPPLPIYIHWKPATQVIN
jgi:hypothetical protein